jgi:4a-hydroxytetrahydrobiopterin dehydratase
MARPTPLSDDELAEHLKDIPLWRRDGATIVREIPCSDFASAIGLVNAIALHAEKMDHHPDLLVYGWNKVRITLSTHDQGALTILDIRLAKSIDTLSINQLDS